MCAVSLFLSLRILIIKEFAMPLKSTVFFQKLIKELLTSSKSIGVLHILELKII